MKPHLLALALLAAPAAAQTPILQEIQLFDGAAEAAWRPLGATNEGELLQKVPGTHFGNLGSLRGLRAVVQDQERATAEKVWVVVRRPDGAGKPDLAAAGLLHQEGPFTISGGGSGPGAWNLSFPLTVPLVLPAGDLFVGLRLAAGLSSADFASLHLSADYPTNACGEHPRQGVRADPGWQVVYAGGAPATAANLGFNLAWDLGLLFATPCLQGFAVDPMAPCLGKRGAPDAGLAALWPDLVDLEKYGYLGRFGWRLRDRGLPGAPAFLFLSGKRLGAPYALPGLGEWHLDPLDPWFSVVISMSLDATGQAWTAELDAPVAVRPLLLGSWVFGQAVAVELATVKVVLSNWAGISF